MSAENIASVDLVIDADGLRRTGQALRSLEKYMEQLRKRAELLSRVRITPIVRLNDCLCGPIRQIRLKLTELTKRAWVVPIRAKFVLDAKLLERLKASIKLNVSLNIKADALVRVMTQVDTKTSDSKGKEDKDKKPIWKDQLDKLGSDIADTYRKRLAKVATDFGDSILTKLSGVKAFSPLKFLLPKKEVYDVRVTNMGELLGSNLGNLLTGESGKNGAPGKDGTSGKLDSGRDAGSLPTEEKAKPRGIKRLFSRGKGLFASLGKKVFRGGRGKIGTVTALAGAGLEQAMEKAGPAALDLSFAKTSKTADLIQKSGGFKSWIKGGANRLLSLGKKMLSGGAAKVNAEEAGEGIPELSQTAETVARKSPLRSIAGRILKTSGKLITPLSIGMSVADIATAKPGKERNKAIGSAIGGNVGAAALGALGTLIAPGVGTALGATVGGIAGDWLGGQIGGAIGSLKKFNPFKKKKKAPETTPTPTDSFAAKSAESFTAAKTQVNASTNLNVQIPAGAVQLSMQQKLDYDAIANEIGVRMAASIKQTVENRV